MQKSYRSSAAKRNRPSRKQRRRRISLWRLGRFIVGCVLLAAIASSVFNGFSQPQSEISGDRQSSAQSEAAVDAKLSNTLRQDELGEKVTELVDSNGRPRLDPLPPAEEVWECQVVVVGGSLGGIAAAGHAMATGA
ncbi:MAG: hypothetical protein AAF728_20785, partial [Cyanobacteria bacterium P01_D01_bin.128]